MPSGKKFPSQGMTALRGVGRGRFAGGSSGSSSARAFFALPAFPKATVELSETALPALPKATVELSETWLSDNEEPGNARSDERDIG